MKTLLKTIAAIALMISVTSCANAKSASNSGNVIKKTLTVSSFNDIEVSSAMKVIFEQSNGEYSVVAEIPSRFENKFSFEQSGKSLEFWMKGESNFHDGEEVRLYIKAPSIKGVELSGASTFTAQTINQANKGLDIECSGASRVSIKQLYVKSLSIDCSGASNAGISNISADKISVDCSGASKATISGKAGYVEYDASGASTISAEELLAERGEVDASGVSKIVCNISNVTDWDSSGMSSIKNKN